MYLSQPGFPGNEPYRPRRYRSLYYQCTTTTPAAAIGKMHNVSENFQRKRPVFRLEATAAASVGTVNRIFQGAGGGRPYSFGNSTKGTATQAPRQPGPNHTQTPGRPGGPGGPRARRPQAAEHPAGEQSEAPRRRSAADRQTQASGNEGRRGGHRHAHDPPRGSSAGRGAHRAAAIAKPSPDPTGGAGRGRAKANPPKGGRPCAPPLKPRRRARSAPEHGAGGPTRTAMAKPAA